MKNIISIILMLSLSMLFNSTSAQEPDTPCSPDAVSQALTTASDIVEQLQTRMESGEDPTTLAADLETVKAILNQINITCFQVEASPTRQPVTYYISSGRGVNARSCPQTTCNVVTILSPGAAVLVVGTAEGEVVSGSNQWHKVLLGTAEMYIHSSLVSNQPPSSTSVPVQPTAAPLVSPAPPVQAQPIAPAFTCDCSKTCGSMASCEEAYFQLNQCGCSRRDSDNDGVPCESICPGG